MCPPGWIANSCALIDPKNPHPTAAQQLAYIKLLATSTSSDYVQVAANEVNEAAASSSRPLPVHLGRGRSSIAHDLTAAQVLHLTYDTAAGSAEYTHVDGPYEAHWTIPAQARFEPMTGGSHWGKTTSSAFDSWRTYLNSDFVTPYSMSGMSMIPGLPKALRISDTGALIKKMFGSGQDIMVVTNQIFPSYRVSFPPVQNMSVAYVK